MNADEYRDALATWKLRHKAAAEFFGITVITSQRYATGEREVPAAMAKLIGLRERTVEVAPASHV